MSDFKEQFECTFEPDPRILQLERRYKELYDASDVNYSIRYMSFKRFCDDGGYTREEIKRAKQIVSSQR